MGRLHQLTLERSSLGDMRDSHGAMAWPGTGRRTVPLHRGLKNRLITFTSHLLPLVSHKLCTVCPLQQGVAHCPAGHTAAVLCACRACTQCATIYAGLRHRCLLLCWCQQQRRHAARIRTLWVLLQGWQCRAAVWTDREGGHEGGRLWKAALRSLLSRAAYGQLAMPAAESKSSR